MYTQDLVYIYTPPPVSEGAATLMENLAGACCVSKYFPVKTDKLRWIEPQTDPSEIWLQKPGSLWPSSACLLFFPNKRIR